MEGPEPQGQWTSRLGPRDFQGLRAGQRYAVVRAFTDYDGDLHPVGETWTFLSHSFLPYEDGLSLFVSLDGTREWHLRMQWRPEQQAAIIDKLPSYVQPAL